MIRGVWASMNPEISERTRIIPGLRDFHLQPVQTGQTAGTTLMGLGMPSMTHGNKQDINLKSTQPGNRGI